MTADTKYLSFAWLLAFAALLVGCDKSKETVSSNRILLEKITGEKITFMMCGKNISLPRKYVTRFESNGYEGLTPEPVTEVRMWIDLGAFKGLHASELAGQTSATIACSEKKPWQKYWMGEENFTGYQVLHALGLQRLDVAPPVLRFDSYYQPIDKNERSEGFFLACQDRNKDDTPAECWIWGSPHEGVEFRIAPYVGSTLRNWRIYKDVFENFIKIEEQH